MSLTNQKTRRQIRDGAINDAKIGSDAAISSAKLAAWSENRAAGGYRLTGLGAAVDETDAVTKGQVAELVAVSASGLVVKDTARAATMADLPITYTATGGDNGRGRITGAPNTVDGVSLSEGDRVLVKSQTNPDENGIYVVSTLGAGSNGVWDRSHDANHEDVLPPNSFLFVSEGSANADTQWVLVSDDPLVVGGSSGTALTFTKFGGGASYSADGSTLELVGSQFRVKDLGITEGKLAAGAVTEGKIGSGAVTESKIGSGAVTATKLGADAVITSKIADLNVTEGKLASNSVTDSKIATGAVTEGKLGTGAVTEAKIGTGAVTVDKIGSGAVTSGKISMIATAVAGDIDGVNDSYTMSAAPGFCLVFLNGDFVDPDDYSISSTTLTFGTPPETGDTIRVWGFTA